MRIEIIEGRFEMHSKKFAQKTRKFEISSTETTKEHRGKAKSKSQQRTPGKAEAAADRCVSSFLKIFPGPIPNALQRFLEVFHGIGDAESQKALSELAEGSTGETGDASFLEKSVGQLL